MWDRWVFIVVAALMAGRAGWWGWKLGRGGDWLAGAGGFIAGGLSGFLVFAPCRRRRSRVLFCTERSVVNEVKRTMIEKREQIGQLWRKVNRTMHDRLRHMFHKTEMPFGAVIFLRLIKEQPGVTISELARQSGMAKSHVSKMLEHMDERGLVERRSDPEDQRLLRLYLSPLAEERVHAMEASALAAWLVLLEGIPDAQLDQVARGLQILLTALEQSTQVGQQTE